MIKSLEIKDYALIEHINVEFGNGLNIITGETGAGKSILIDAMSLLLGERATTEVIRKGAPKSLVEGIFSVAENNKVKKLLEENEIEFSDELIMRREISLKGTNRCFVNDTPVSLNFIKEIGNYLVDIHGQHEHQSLLRTETHIDFLDEFGNYTSELTNYKVIYDLLNKAKRELNSLKEKESFLKEKTDIFSFQIKEIDSISPEDGEEDKLISELNIMENSEKLLELTSSIYQKIFDEEDSIYDSLVKIKNKLDELSNIDSSFSENHSECETALTLIKDISQSVRDYNSKIDLEQENLDKIRERLSSINLLKKKYGGSVNSVLEFRKKIGNEFDLATNYSENISALEEQINKLRFDCGIAAENISKKRKIIGNKIQNEVVDVLNLLGITNATFKVNINQIVCDKSDENFITFNKKNFRYYSSGYDEVEFFITTNQGEDPKSLSKVASGGEVSRIMLALKTILAKNDKLPLLIFDEIDTGVSGRVAQKVGQSLKSLASFHQIISITHLPQIAGLADHHFAVEKKFNSDRVVSDIRKLNKEERIKEVAKLMSGELISEASIKSAKELMGL